MQHTPSATDGSFTDAMEVTYWGVTGTFPRPLTSTEITRKLAVALSHIHITGQWDELQRRVKEHDSGALAHFLEAHAPFPACGTFLGNTTCIEVCIGGARFLLDAGSGLREWSCRRRKDHRESHLLLTHAHLDHIMGMPFCDTFFDATRSLTVWAAPSVLASVRKLLEPATSDMSPWFAITREQLVALREWKPLNSGSTLTFGRTQLRVLDLCHPGGALALRFDHGSTSLVMVTDHEQLEQPDRRLAEFARGASLLYHDAQYLQSEYEGLEGISGGDAQSRRGWGHSSLESCLDTAIAAGVQRLHLGHHEPRRTDSELATIEEYAQEQLRGRLRAAGLGEDAIGVELAREGQTFFVQ